jgi:hypothetical protein
MNIDDLRPDFMDLIANHFKGKFNINIPVEDRHSKYIHSTLFAEVSPLEIYKTSIKYHISFDKYEKEFIFYTSIKKSIETMIGEFQRKINKIVIDTFIENGEELRLKGFTYNILDKIKFDKIVGKEVIPEKRNNDGVDLMIP